MAAEAVAAAITLSLTLRRHGVRRPVSVRLVRASRIMVRLTPAQRATPERKVISAALLLAALTLAQISEMVEPVLQTRQVQRMPVVQQRPASGLGSMVVEVATASLQVVVAVLG